MTLHITDIGRKKSHLSNITHHKHMVNSHVANLLNRQTKGHGGYIRKSKHRVKSPKSNMRKGIGLKKQIECGYGPILTFSSVVQCVVDGCLPSTGDW